MACPALQYFSTLSHKRHDFRGKKRLLIIKCVSNFSISSVRNVFHSKKNGTRYDEELFIGLHVKYPVFLPDIDVTLIFLDRSSKNTQT